MPEAYQEWITFAPSFTDPSEVRAWTRFIDELDCEFLERDVLPPWLCAELRERADRNLRADTLVGSLRVLAAANVLTDLIQQGWLPDLDERALRVHRPVPPKDREEERERARQALLVARDEQLAEPPVQEFIGRMNTPRRGVSITALFADGEGLADRLREAGSAEGVIQPYLQFVGDGEVCSMTDIPLQDIWRYFRYLWVNPARSAPGRTMPILIRDAGALNHPVMGIAALTSAVVQQTSRDRFLGWQPDAAIERLQAEASDEDADWLAATIRRQIDDLYLDDLIERGLVTRASLRRPSAARVASLFAVLEAEPAATGEDTLEEARTGYVRESRRPMFVRKRVEKLAGLLSARRTLQAYGLPRSGAEGVRRLIESAEGRLAVRHIVRQAKAERVGVDLMEISVCGAVPPYNDLLGGKLVTMLLTSPEVRQEYARRYGAAQSVIASAMKGAPVVREPRLVALATTGLYAGGSSQYNRVRVPAAEVGGGRGEVRYVEVGQTLQYSTFHFSAATMRVLGTLVQVEDPTRWVRAVFGEGVNARMRKIRQELSLLGLPSDDLLKTGSSRTVYVVPLAHNFRRVLLGLETQPDYILDAGDGPAATARIAAFWARRWAQRRVQDPEVLARVVRHSAQYPVLHGAYVASATSEGEQPSLWDDDEAVAM